MCAQCLRMLDLGCQELGCKLTEPGLVGDQPRGDFRQEQRGITGLMSNAAVNTQQWSGDAYTAKADSLPCLALIAYRDRKSTRLNSSHGYISYAVFCLKKKKKKIL